MQKLRQLLEYLWPELILQGTPWFREWSQGNKEQFANRSRIFFTLVGATYIGHYYFVDIPNNKQPLEAWFAFRMTMATLSAGCVLLYINRTFIHSKLVKWPAILVMALGCHTQAHVPIYFPDAPWIYPYLFVFSSVLLLGTSPLKSLLFALPIMASFVAPLTAAGLPVYQLSSATAVCAVVIFVVRSAYVSEIRNFLLTQERDQYRGAVIDLGKEYEGRLKSFIPKVISDRLEDQIENTKMNVLEATLDVLEPKKQEVACMWSDIRGFTQGSNDIDSFLADSVMPEVKACSDAVENHQGIPRKIGDLIFAYFDDRNIQLNLLRAISAGFALSELNKDMNATVSTVDVKRYILVSTGEALVGNVGGLNSGVEITALGPPVNFLARLDDATKSPGLMKHLEPGDIILCPDSARKLEQMKSELEPKRVCLNEAGVDIRDFPDVRSVFILRPSQPQHLSLSNAYKKIA